MAIVKLASFVHVVDEAGRVFVFGPDDDVPAWAAKKITNPRAWATPPSIDTEPEPGDDVPKRPPTSGRGSGIEAWTAYAAARDIEVPNGANRDDIVALVDTADASNGAGEE